MPTALISVWDKSGIAELGRRLAGAGFELLSTGGTATTLRASGLAVTDVSAVTGFPEILDGRVKTLHPAIHAGLLARRDRSEHLTTLEQHGLRTIDILVSNLYPFASVVQARDVSDDDAIEHIDIGGPAMVRAAAKNHQHVVVLVDPADYDDILDVIERDGVQGVPAAMRQRLAAKAFGHVAVYDSLVARFLRDDAEFPTQIAFGGSLLHTTRYGENPHQRGAVYALSAPGELEGVATWHIHDEREMSYNNYLDASAAWGCAQEYTAPTVVIVKHTLPCGVGSSDDLVEAYRQALSGDPVSAFGGIMACNRPVSADVVDAIGRHRFDVIIAPGYHDGVVEQLLRRRNLRLITVGNPATPAGWEVRSIPGGLLVQEPDRAPVDPASWRCVTRVQPTTQQLATLAFAWRAVRWVKSNAIVLAQPDVVVGVGAGQPNRVESVRIAVRVAGDRARGSVLASDAFFPFPDGVEVACDAGVTVIAQPGGSVRDDEIISTADRYGVAMLITGTRHFRH
jgi:phosphoribosylaminoimidazolecarboxamide formyltransferase/IMP cyclohydrolase